MCRWCDRACLQCAKIWEAVGVHALYRNDGWVWKGHIQALLEFACDDTNYRWWFQKLTVVKLIHWHATAYVSKVPPRSEETITNKDASGTGQKA